MIRLELIWHGTASIELRSSGDRILFDPFFPYPGSETEVLPDEFDGFTDILVTHGHFDHIGSIPLIWKRNRNVTIWCTETPRRTLIKSGVPDGQLRRITPGEAFCVCGFRITPFQSSHAVLAKNPKKRIPYILRSPHRRNFARFLREHLTSPENGETLLYLVERDGKRIAVMGSLNLRDDVRYPKGCDALILPYNGWEDNDPPARSAIERLSPKRVFLDHYDDTFPPMTMPIDLTQILQSGRAEICRLKPRQRIEI